MKNNFFIMLRSKDGKNISPIMRGEDDDEIFDTALYETREEAETVAKNHSFCKAWGYQIFEFL